VARRVEDYDGATKVLTIEPDLSLVPAEGDSFTILKQIAVPTTKINTIQTDVADIKIDVADIKIDVAAMKSQLDNIDSNISSLQNNVQSSVTNIYQVKPEDMYPAMTTISTSIQNINNTLGKLDSTLLTSLLSISEESLGDIKYIRNKLADFKAVTTIQRQVIERAEAPVVNTWYTSGSVELNIMVSNPASTAQKVPIKIYLPKEAKMEHIMDNGGLDIQYDVQLDTLYAIGEFQLGPSEVLKKTVKMRDIWQLAEEDLNLMKTQSENLMKQLEKSQFYAQAVLLKNDLDTRIEKIIRTQAENNASPQDKIMTYRENKESLIAAQRSLDELKSLVTQSAAAQGFLGSFGGVQTIVVWGIIIAFVTGFSLMIMVLFMMWRHQMKLAGGQLALQSHILSGGKVDTQTLAKIFADGVVTPQEEDNLKKYLSKTDIEKVKKRLSKTKVQDISQKLSASFFGYLKKIFAEYGLKIIFFVLALVSIFGLIFVYQKYFKGLSSIFSQTESVTSQIHNQFPTENDPVTIPSKNQLENIKINLENSNFSETSSTSSTDNKITTSTKLTLIQIKQTSTGWLNVRNNPSKNSEIIDKVNVGDRIESIGFESSKNSDEFGWYKIILPNSKEGWIYEEYVEIIIDE
jgi:uncharacterized protein YukE